MRIAHVITGLEVGGAEMMLYKLLSAMDRQSFAPLVISLIALGPVAARIHDLGIETASLQMARGMQGPGALMRLVGHLRRFRPDLIQTWMYHANLLGSLVLPLLARPRPPLVWNIRQSDLDPRLTRRGTRAAASLGALLSQVAPERIVCCSERAAEVHRALGYRARILSVIPNGFELDRFRPDPLERVALRSALQIPADAPLLGLVARFDPQKDVRTFLTAASRVRLDRPDCRFLICGSGMDRDNAQLMAWIAEAGLTEVLILLGPRADAPRVFAALDLMVLSSAYGEGFPNVIGEAMACQVPCVVTDVGDSALIVGDTGQVVAPRDPQALAGAIESLLSEGRDALASRGRAARERIARSYALPQIATRYAELYQSLYRGKGRCVD